LADNKKLAKSIESLISASESLKEIHQHCKEKLYGGDKDASVVDVIAAMNRAERLRKDIMEFEESLSMTLLQNSTKSKKKSG
jgi:hypothetical protein